MRLNTQILSLISYLSNIGWLVAYSGQSIAHGITLTYQDASFDTVDKMLDQALVVANGDLVDKPLSEVKAAIKTDSYGLQPFIKEGCMYAGAKSLEIGPDSTIAKVRTESNAYQGAQASTLDKLRRLAWH